MSGKLHTSYETFLHPSYNKFVKEQKPKYGKTFVEWYEQNREANGVDILKVLIAGRERVFESPIETTIGLDGGLLESQFLPEVPTYFLDVFTKKLQLCKNLLNSIGNYPTYSPEVAVEIMDLYEDIIYEISTRQNVGVSWMTSGLYKKGVTYHVMTQQFANIEDFKNELVTGEVVVYFFGIRESGAIICRMAKREVLTRKILTEKSEKYE